MKALKVAGIVFGCILVLVLAGAAFVVSQFDGERIKREVAQAVQEKKQRTLKINGDIKLSFWPNLGVSIGKVSLSEYKSEQEFAAIDSMRISVALLPLLSKHIAVNDVQLTGLKASVVKHKDGTLNISDLLVGDAGSAAAGAGKSPAAGEPLQLDIAGIAIANAAFVWENEQDGSGMTISGLDLNSGRVQIDSARKEYQVAKLSLAVKGKNESKGGTDTFDIKLDAPQIGVTPEKAGGDSVNLQVTLTGLQRNVVAKLALAGIEGKSDALKIGRLVLDIDAKLNESAVKGQLASALAADLGKQTVSMDKIEGSFDIGDPRMPMKQIKMPVSGALHADLARQSADGGLATQIDDTKISLKFGATKFSPLALNFDLGADKLNLDKYFPPQPAGEKAEPKSAGTAAAGEDKIDFSALKTLTLNGAIRVGQLQAHNVKVGDLRIPLHIAAGRLDAAPLTANLYEGTLNGAFSADAADNAVAIRQNLSGIRIGTLLKDAANKDVLDGRGNVALNVAAHGKTLGEMKKALAGTASLSLKDGAIKGIDLAQSFRDLKGKFGAKQDQTLASKAADKTDFSELAATFNIANGVAHNDDLAAKSPFLRLAGSGDIDIGASRLNYLLKASIVATSGGQGAKELENLKGITVPVRLTGPFDSPSWQIEFAGMAGAAAQAAIDQTKQKAQDKVKDKLKGLFGR